MFGFTFINANTSEIIFQSQVSDDVINSRSMAFPNPDYPKIVFAAGEYAYDCHYK
jgi:hypothetical protein